MENRIGGETTWEEGVSYVEFRGVFGVLFCFVSVGAVGAVEGLDVGYGNLLYWYLFFLGI